MSLCAVGSLEVNSVGSLARNEELAIVPDVQGFNYMFCDSTSQKRYRNYSDCFSGEEEEEEQLNLQNCDSFSAPNSKRLCKSSSNSVICSPDSFQAANISSKAESFTFGTSPADSNFIFSGAKPSPQSSASSLPSSSSLAESPAACVQSLASDCFDSIELLADIQHPPEMLPHQQATPHSSDSYKLVIIIIIIIIIVTYLQYYRARYDSEGVRAPLKGLVENYPAVQVRSLHMIFMGKGSKPHQETTIDFHSLQ